MNKYIYLSRCAPINSFEPACGVWATKRVSDQFYVLIKQQTHLSVFLILPYNNTVKVFCETSCSCDVGKIRESSLKVKRIITQIAIGNGFTNQTDLGYFLKAFVINSAEGLNVRLLISPS